MQFDWDAANAAHLARHGITRTEVEQVFSNAPILRGHDIVDGEERWTAVGLTGTLRVLVLIFTLRGERIRPITGWDADKATSRAYFAERGT